MIKKSIRKINNFSLKKKKKEKKKKHRRKKDKKITLKTKNLFKKINKLNIRKKSVLFLACFVIISLFFSKNIFWIAVLMLAVSISKLIQIFFPLVVGFDWGSFACIFIGYYIDPIVGLICISIASIIGSLLRGQHKPDMIALPIFGYISITLMFLFFPFESMSFFNATAILTFIYAGTNILFSFFFMGRIDINFISFLLTLIINNFFLIKYISIYIVKSAGL